MDLVEIIREVQRKKAERARTTDRSLLSVVQKTDDARDRSRSDAESPDYAE